MKYFRKIRYLIIMIFMGMLLVPTFAMAKGNRKVIICHIPPGNPKNATTINISIKALRAHLAHGDKLGRCDEDPKTPTLTFTPILPTVTDTATPTALPPTATDTATPTALPPTVTDTATPTALPPTATDTATPTALPPTATDTATPTPTALPPTATDTATPIPVP